MAMKDYSDEFKADAVALYESTLGVTCKDIAADLGINRATLREWVLRDRDRRGIVPTDARRGGTAPARAGEPSVSAGPDERIRRLEARVAEFEARERKPATERDILRKAAKYFAEETNWWTASSSSTTTGTPTR